MGTDTIMRSQRGLITRDQALGAGLTRRNIDYRLRRGTWIREQPRVYRHAAVPHSWEQRLLAATLVSDHVVVSHRSAVALFGLGQFRQPVPEVSQPHAIGRIALQRVDVHRSTQWAGRQECSRRGIRCTGVERTLLDVAEHVAIDQLERLAEEAVRRRLTGFGSLATYLTWHGRRGRTGSATMRRMLLRRAPDAPLPLSDFSRLVTNLLRDAGLPEPELEYRVTDRDGRFVMQADLAWPALAKIVELDGLAWHFGRTDVERDRRKRARARAAGWRVQEILWSMYADDPAGLSELIGDFLGS